VTFEFLAFYILISFYLVDEILIKRFVKSRIVPYAITKPFIFHFSRIYQYIQDKFDRTGVESISKLELIQLSFRNMKVKKTRTLITIGGVSIGIASIVFLVSLGYGLQNLVVSRVARLDELRQADVTTQAGSKVKIDDKILSEVKQFTDVEDVYPLIAVVARINYNNSISDMAAYGVTTKYLEKSAIKPVKGKIFQSHDISFKQSLTQPQVAGATTERYIPKSGQKVAEVKYSISPDEWIRVRSGLDTSSSVIGYTKRVEEIQYADVYYGQEFIDNEFGSFESSEKGEKLGIWLRSQVKLWKLSNCNTSVNSKCIDNKYEPLEDSQGNQVSKIGYFAHINISTNDLSEQIAKFGTSGNVLGISTTSSNQGAPQVLASETKDVNETTSANPIGNIKIDDSSDWVELIEGDSEANTVVNKVKMSDQAVREAVVNRAMLNLLGIKEEMAINKKFSVSFVIPAELTATPEKRVESEPVEYVITGVTTDDASPIIYVPFVDLRSLGIINYTQFKVDARNTGALDKIRKQVESIGFSTQSVVDTVEQINSLFDNIRLVLGIVGTVALAVASLGMFNTLTISLLERSREVGLMKAMGMKTSEVQELFLTESIIMGSCAGIVGLLLGFIGGKFVGLILTFFSVFKGQGFIDITHIPLSFVLIILFLSLLVGMLTGLYPAKRSKKISALDALRYE
jgi:ABC-type antimicrobial peptide transport system permease subunit